MPSRGSRDHHRLRIALVSSILIAAVAVAVVLLGTKHQGFDPPIHLSEVEQITYAHWSGGPPPMDHEKMTIWVSRHGDYAAWGSPGGGYVGTRSVTVSRSVPGRPEKVYVFNAAVKQEQLEKIVSLLNRMRKWSLPREVVSGPEDPHWQIGARLRNQAVRPIYTEGAYGGTSSRESVSEIWEFTTCGPPTSQAFSELANDLDGMTHER